MFLINFHNLLMVIVINKFVRRFCSNSYSSKFSCKYEGLEFFHYASCWYCIPLTPVISIDVTYNYDE